VTDEARRLEQQAAYIDTVRRLHRTERNAGFVACLVGALILVWARFRAGAPPAFLWVGLGVIALGWALFAYSIVKRLAWVRAHPFIAAE
jgi:uncharacterized membrane protein